MYRFERKDFLKTRFISLWAALGFQAGFLNAFGFLACGRYVTHITGFGTQIGIALGEKSYFIALELLGFPLAFIFGAFASGFLTSARLERELKPRYDVVTLVLPIGILTLLYLGQSGYFGIFGENLIRTRDFALLFSLSFLAGMQNGCFATLTKGQIRTTHLTGISTDMGTDLARIWFGKMNDRERMLTKRTNFTRLATFIAFASGSILSVLTTERFDYLALAIPLVTSGSIFLVIRKASLELDKSYNKAAFVRQITTLERAI